MENKIGVTCTVNYKCLKFLSGALALAYQHCWLTGIKALGQFWKCLVYLRRRSLLLQSQSAGCFAEGSVTSRSSCRLNMTDR